MGLSIVSFVSMKMPKRPPKFSTRTFMNRSMRLAIVFFCASLSVGIWSSCKRKNPLDESVIRIGEVGSLTGPDATFGTSTHRGILIAVQEANATGGVQGKKVELQMIDDQGTANEAVLAITKLIHQQGVRAVLGEVASSLSLAMAPIAQRAKVPMISPSSISSKLTEQGNYIFRVCFVDRFQAKVMAEFASKNLKAKTVAILTDHKSDYSRDSTKMFIEYFKKFGGSVLIEQSYSAGDIDFKSQLTVIRGLKPDVILVPGYYTDVGLIARQKVELGIVTPLLGGDGWDSPKLSEIGGEALKDSFFVGHFYPKSELVGAQKFIDSYKKAYGLVPDGLAALGYDAAWILLEGLKRSNLASPDTLREAVASTKDFQGITGKISIGPDRNAIKAASVFRISAAGVPQFEALMNPE
jgi:branched-chain amino acid transport system substrate-binding protein